MKKIAMAFALLASCVVVGQGYCQEGPRTGADGKTRTTTKKAHRSDARIFQREGSFGWMWQPVPFR